MNIPINISSFNNISHNADQLMVYGWENCKYDFLAFTLQSIYNKIVFSYVAACSRDTSLRTTKENRLIEQLPLSSSATVRDVCKIAITDLVLENYKRKDQGLPIIPLVFCCDITGNTHIFNVDTVASLNPELNNKITNKELRRCYKMCTADERDARLNEIAKVAQQTMIFVKIIGDDTSGYTFEQMTPFWEMPDFEAKWQQRQAQKQSTKTTRTPKEHPWRTDLLRAIDRYKVSK